MKDAQKFLGPTLYNALLIGRQQATTVEHEATVCVAGIVGMAVLLDVLEPMQLVDRLNNHFGMMTEIIYKNGGTVVTFNWDEIIYLWNAEGNQLDHAIRGCACAMEMITALDKYNESLSPYLRLPMTIGISTGIVSIGNTGTNVRLQYGVFGDNVNLAARLQQANRLYYTTTLASELTYQKVRDAMICRELDDIRVRGNGKAAPIYEIIATRPIGSGFKQVDNNFDAKEGMPEKTLAGQCPQCHGTVTTLIRQPHLPEVGHCDKCGHEWIIGETKK
jgi:adenylate cyclase